MRLTETYHDLSTNWYRKGMVVSSTVEFPKVTQKVTGNLKAYCKTIDASVHSSHRDNPSALSCMRGRSSSVPSREESIPSNQEFPATRQPYKYSRWPEEYQLAKKARPVREDHLERQETAEELRQRIRVLFKLKQTPDDKHVKFLLSRLEKYKRTGYV